MQQVRSWKAQKVIERLSQKINRQILLSLEACVHCGLCTDQCHYVLANPDDVTYAPAYKADQIRKFFKAHLDWTGRAFPWWVGARSLYTDQELEDLKDTVFGKCTNCRRCSLACPMGVDMATFNRMARGLLSWVGVMPEGVAVVAKDQWEIGNQMGVLKEDYLETLKWMEEELQEEYHDPAIRIPVDQPDCNVVYAINPEPVTYHDSCNNARSCGMFEEPRELLRLVCLDFREMYPNRAENYCCTGGGGAMSMSEYAPRRLKSARVKAEQLRATGAKIVVTSCHNCVDGLFDLIRHYKLDMQVKLLVSLVANALVAPVRVPVPAARRPLEGRTILVIDDEPDVRLYLSKIFAEQGCEVMDAPDANQAMRAIKSRKPDLITLDLVLPRKTGEKLYWELRRDPLYRDLPVVVVSGYASIESPRIDFHGFLREKGLPDPEGFIEKPVDVEKLLETVRCALQDSRRAQG
jgi:Fe-S oxidoreductase